MKEIYLDNSATTKVLEEVARAVFDTMTLHFGNPSSLHRKGIEAEKIMQEARENIAKALGASPKEIYFTSGGTESNNWAVKGAAYARRRKGNHLITTAIEHPSVLETFAALEREGFSVTYLQVDREGFIDLNQLKEALTPETILVSIMYVNNEVGTIEPIQGAAQIIKASSNALFHVDAVQAFAKIPLVSKLEGIDLLSLSGHKIYGPKGIGALFVRDKVSIAPLLHGGGQETGQRSGTENLPGIAGFGKAAKICIDNLEKWHSQMVQLKERLMKGILDNIPDTVLNGPVSGAPHILNISFLGTRGEILLHALESKNIYVSTGSACSSHKSGNSHVLKAMGKSEEEQDGAIRFSLSPFLSMEDIDYTIEVLADEVREIRKLMRR
ncbi:MAG TPA: cysteine desulfurase [Thermoanaerobacterales bacterium]|uniref:cysteine desulfurase family protein n=1 Tax=Tepidanaerobacter sp. GT38 TaxID=2722793 RepID=UPI0017D74879|nr:cysteine desulfurase family protein [Tepidanaerobacter sp. GT38]MCG1011924.1 cysteine desulfurase [Tepidanaerobacter sp. GT38]HHY41330.1 cysteine desulfurase [Thermoanaerobacterales bacterium]